MENTSPFLAIGRANTLIRSLLRAIDVDLLTPDERKAAASLRRLSTEARLDIRDYELSETRAEQIKKAREARKRLAALRANMLAIGYVLAPADVAQVDALLEQINGWIE